MKTSLMMRTENEMTIKQLFESAQMGDRDAFRQLLDLRAMGNEEAMSAVAELNRRDAIRMANIFA